MNTLQPRASDIAMQAGTFIQQLFRFDPPPGILPLRAPVPTFAATLRRDGALTCEEITVQGLSALPDLCRGLLAAGHSDAALQVRTTRGEPVCFVLSLSAMAAIGDHGAPSTQLEFGFGL